MVEEITIVGPKAFLKEEKSIILEERKYTDKLEQIVELENSIENAQNYIKMDERFITNHEKSIKKYKKGNIIGAIVTLIGCCILGDHTISSILIGELTYIILQTINTLNFISRKNNLIKQLTQEQLFLIKKIDNAKEKIKELKQTQNRISLEEPKIIKSTELNRDLIVDSLFYYDAVMKNEMAYDDYNTEDNKIIDSIKKENAKVKKLGGK